MRELSFNAIQQLQFIHDSPVVARFIDTSDSPMWDILRELLDGGSVSECQGYQLCGDEMIEAGPGYEITPAGNAYLLEFSKNLETKNITEIYLNKREYKMLKKMNKMQDFEVADEDIPPLVQSGVANFRYINRGRGERCIAVCNITNTGKRYLSYRKEDTKKTWIPVVISLFALLVSVCAYFKVA